MSRRDIIYSITGHVLAVAILILLPTMTGGFSSDRPMSLIVPVVGLVEDIPHTQRIIEELTPKLNVPEPAPEDVEILEPFEITEKETIGEEETADSVEVKPPELAQADEDSAREAEGVSEEMASADTLDRAGELSHTINDGEESGVDDIFGEHVPAIGHGATDPYWQALFLAVQRAFRNPVPGYKTVRCVVTYTVLNTGEIIDIKLETQSGIPRFDRAAVRAVESIQWNQPFPDKFSDYDGFYIRMPFEYAPR